MAETPELPGDHVYHAACARSELDAAFRAANASAADAHLQLCAFHLQAASVLLRRAGAPPGPELDWLERLMPFHRRCLGFSAVHEREPLAAE